ncbi:MAG: hypothetical protein ACLUEQ_03285 [Cloacibacillus evryensis]
MAHRLLRRGACGSARKAAAAESCRVSGEIKVRSLYTWRRCGWTVPTDAGL